MKKFLLTSGGILAIVGIIVGVLTFLRYFNQRPSVVVTNPCDAPCWYGITPGQNDTWGVYESLTSLQQIHLGDIYSDSNKRDQLTSYYWFFQRPMEDSGGSIYFDDGTVSAIEILTVGSLKLNDLFEKLGQPEYYWTEMGSGDNREYLDVYLLNPSKGYSAEVVIDIKSGEDHVEISTSSPVFRVDYYLPVRFDTLMQSSILIDKPPHARTGSLQSWEGYGMIDVARK